METKRIDHIGILVEDLEEAIERWERITGYTFSPIHRYRSTHYSDESDREEHLHDARVCSSREQGPHIELLEVTGTGTHAAKNLGVHHVAFAGYDDLEGERDHLASIGIGVEGVDVNEAGELLLFFAEPSDTDRVRLEFVAPKDHPNVMDDGGPMWRNPGTGRFDPWGPQQSVGV